ncbi:MAG TPA: lipopolysaccharide kinase InaA family protein [Methylophilaceae bacterium]|nr:lipopolysaccharide kinase InaA family protein [Methylophilaceae bacterium]HQR60078.1 lipopolysaccharide kinase InaA family protein [Methylophilaceae bacterium]
MSDFIYPAYRQLLESNHLASFDQLWSYQAEWFEEPNNRRGGWSGAGRVVLRLPDGGEAGVFLKRQENHQRPTLRHPLRGEPTFAREFRMLRFLQSRGVPAPVPVFFGQRAARAILVSEELAGFRSLEDVTEDLFADDKRPPLSEQRALLRGVAAMVRKMHDAGIHHRSLYPKHLFVNRKAAGDPLVAVIDLEKSRATLLATPRTIYDLATLNRHARAWSKTARMYFFKHYLGIERLSPWHKLLCRLILKRSQRPKQYNSRSPNQ